MNTRLCLEMVAAHLDKEKDNLYTKRNDGKVEVYEEDTFLGVIQVNEDDTLEFIEEDGDVYYLFENLKDATSFRVKDVLIDFYQIISRQYLDFQEER